MAPQLFMASDLKFDAAKHSVTSLIMPVRGLSLAGCQCLQQSRDWGAEVNGMGTCNMNGQGQHWCERSLCLGIARCQRQAEKEENLLGGSRPLPWTYTHPQASSLGCSGGNGLLLWGGGAILRSAAGLVLLLWLFSSWLWAHEVLLSTRDGSWVKLSKSLLLREEGEGRVFSNWSQLM